MIFYVIIAREQYQMVLDVWECVWQIMITKKNQITLDNNFMYIIKNFNWNNF